MRNSNHKLMRGFGIFFNATIFLSAFVVLGMIIFYIISNLRGDVALTSSFAPNFQSFIDWLIKENLFWTIILIIYFAAMQLIYSALVIKWFVSLDDEQLRRHSWLILIYGFFNTTFWIGLWVARMNADSQINTNMRVKRKLAHHESKVFLLSGVVTTALMGVLMASNIKNENVTNILPILLGVGVTLIVIGFLGVISLISVKNSSLSLQGETLNQMSTNSVMEVLAKVMIAFNIVFVLAKMAILLLINTIIAISNMFDRRSGFFNRVANAVNLVLMYMIVYAVFKAILVKDDRQPLVIDIPERKEAKASFN